MFKLSWIEQTREREKTILLCFWRRQRILVWLDCRINVNYLYNDWMIRNILPRWCWPAWQWVRHPVQAGCWLDSLSVVRDGDVLDKREIGNHAIHLLLDQHQHSQHWLIKQICYWSHTDHHSHYNSLISQILELAVQVGHTFLLSGGFQKYITSMDACFINYLVDIIRVLRLI